MFKALDLLKITLYTYGFLLAVGEVSLAQVTSDNTVNTMVNQNGNVAEITGGERQGGNLFHSFQDFSVPTNNEAFFNNASDISNILSRVTGGNISNIDGLIRANGEANLFLINPAGIIFGSNARLDLGGSFLGSTADGLLFDDGTEFSATNTQAEPILTINAPIGLNFRENPQPITNRSTANDVGLQVDVGKNITLVGGELNFEGGRLTAPGGRIELGGLSTSGEIGISSDGNLTFADGIARADLTFADGAFVDVTANGGGFININANNLNLRGESSLMAGIAEGSTTPEAQAGDITVNATGAIALRESSSIQNLVNSDSIGNAGNIEIDVNTMNIDRALINASSFGRGRGGNIQILASESVEITGSGLAALQQNIVLPATQNPTFFENFRAEDVPNAGFQGILSATISSEGAAAGNINLDTANLSLKAGGLVATATTGAGTAGNITVNASESLKVNGGFISSSSINIGQAGNMEFNTPRFVVEGGGQIAASTLASGDGGDLTINATEFIELRGTAQNGLIPSSLLVGSQLTSGTGNSGSLKINTSRLAISDGAEVTASTLGTGNGGSIEINATDSVNLKNDASIAVNSLGGGNAGELSILTDSLTLKGSELSAETVASQGGNIELKISNLLSLEDNSTISTSAGSQGTNANGGNIQIDANFIVAFPLGNSDITANAFQGTGGAIQISTQGIFGIAERELNPDSNDINASSDFGLDGSIAIEIFDPETYQKITAPAENIFESEQQVVAGICNPIQTAQNVEAGKQNNSTIIVRGRGGLPNEPGQSLVSDNILIDNQITSTNKKSEARKEEVLSPIITAQGKIYPARGIVRDRDGNLILTAYSPNHRQRNSDNLSFCYPQSKDN